MTEVILSKFGSFGQEGNAGQRSDRGLQGDGAVVESFLHLFRFLFLPLLPDLADFQRQPTPGAAVEPAKILAVLLDILV